MKMHFGIFSLFFWNSTVYAEPSGDNNLVQKTKKEAVLEDIVQEDNLNSKIVELKELENNTTEAHSLKHISDTLSFLSMLGLQPLDNQTLQRAAIQGMLSSIDQELRLGESLVLSKAENHDYISDLLGLRQGYGMSIRILEGKGLFVESVFPGGEAFRAGIQPDDIVIAINNHSFTRLSSQDMLHILNEPITNDVRFDIERKGEHKHVRVKKGKFRVDNVSVANQSIRIHYFGQGAAQELEEALNSNNDSIILDLRDNSGGLLTEVSAALGLFLGEQKIAGYRKLPNGTVYPFFTTEEKSPSIFLPNLPQQVNSVSQMESKLSTPLTMQSDANAMLPKDPMNQKEILDEEIFVIATPSQNIQKNVICLINKGTSGVGELFVSTLRNHGGVVVIGETSAGFAADEHIHPISEELYLKMAYIELLDSNQKSWNAMGIKPDVMVHSTKSLSNSFGHSIDIQLSTAIQIQNSE